MNRLKPQVTGIALGAALAAWLATRPPEPGLRQILRSIFAGVGVAAIVTHLLQRMDESVDSRRSYRYAKTGYLEAMTQAVASGASHPQKTAAEDPASRDSPDWLTLATEAPVHLNDHVFDEQPETEAAFEPTFSDPIVLTTAGTDPAAAFASAMAEGAWASAFEALTAAREQGRDFRPEAAETDRLRKSSMEEIFQRMHSGTVREDVAGLAHAVIETFPDTIEGKTLSQVIGVLRRSAGLCPRCAKPYRGIATACHDCLRGTPEAYQIAWDEDQDLMNGRPG